MKKLLTFFLTALLAFSVGWAETVTTSVTQVQNSTFTWSNSNLTFAITQSPSGATYALETSNNGANTFGRGLQMKGKGSFVFTSSQSFSNVTKVEVVASSNTADCTVAAKVGTTSLGNTQTIASGTANANTTYTFDSTTGLDGKIIITVYDSNASKSVWIQSISVTYTTGGTSTPSLSVSPTSLDITSSYNSDGSGTFTVTGTNLTGAVSVSASTGFTVSPTSISAADAANGAMVTVTYTGTSTSDVTGSVTLSSTGATDANVTLTARKEKPAMPTFSPNGGNYDNGQSVSVSITHPANDVTIYYTTDGTDPTTSSTQYSGAITVSETKTLKAIAVYGGTWSSEVATAEFTFAAPSTTCPIMIVFDKNATYTLTGTGYHVSNPTNPSSVVTGSSTSGYVAEENDGIRFGSGSDTGSLTLNLTSPYNKVKKVVISAKPYSSDSDVTANVTVGNETLSNSITGSDFAEYTFNFNNSSASDVTISSTASRKRFYVESITIYYQCNDPNLTAFPNSISITDDNTSGGRTETFTVSGSNLTNDVTVSADASHSTSFLFNPNSITPNNGVVTNQSVDVTYNGYALSATGLVNVESSGAETKQVNVDYLYDGPIYIVGDLNGSTWDTSNGLMGVQMDKKANGEYSKTITAYAGGQGSAWMYFTKSLNANSFDALGDNRFGPRCNDNYGKPQFNQTWEFNENTLNDVYCDLDTVYKLNTIKISPDIYTVTINPATNKFKIKKYVITVTIDPADGTTFSGSTISGTITDSPAGTIEWSTDGTNWQTYTDGFTLTANQVGDYVTVYARSTSNGVTSAPVSATYQRVLAPAPAAPVFSRGSGPVSAGTVVTITAPAGCTLYVNGSQVNSPYDVTINSATTISAYCVNDEGTSSETVTNSYTISTVCDAEIVFKDNDSDASTAISWNSISGNNSYFEAGESYISGIPQGGVDKVYKATTGLKFASGSSSGSVTFNLAPQGGMKVTQITVSAKQYSSSDQGPFTITTSAGESQITPSLTSTLSNYTLNFSGDPITSITISSPKRAYLKGFTLHYDCTPEVFAPVITPGTGSYYDSQTVTMTCESEGATIHYTTDGNTPTASSPVYEGAFTALFDGVNGSTTIKAIAVVMQDGNQLTSAVTEVVYTWIAPVVNIRPATRDVYNPAVTVVIGCNPIGADVYYTTDGSEPSSSNGTLYEGPFEVTFANLNESVTVKAIAYNQSGAASAVDEATYTYKEKVIAVNAPFFSPLEGGHPGSTFNGTYYGEQTLEIASSTENADIYYVIEEVSGTTPPASVSDPTKSSTHYDGPITMVVNKSYRVKAIAYIGDFASTVSEGYYTILPERTSSNVIYVKDCAEFNALTVTGNSYTVQFMNPVQVVYMSTYVNNGTMGEFCYVRDNSDYACFYLGKRNTHGERVFERGDWIDGNLIKGDPNIWEKNFHIQLQNLDTWPTQILGHNEILPEHTTCTEIANGTKTGSNLWGHYVHVPLTTLSGVADYGTDSQGYYDYKHKGTISDGGEKSNTYYDKFYLWSAGTQEYQSHWDDIQCEGDYDQAFFNSKQSKGATFGVYGIVDYFKDYEPNPFEICPIDFQWVYQPVITPATNLNCTTQQVVDITVETPEWVGAQTPTIYYKTDDMEDWEEFIGPFIVNSDTHVYAYAELPSRYDDMLHSKVISTEYKFIGIEDPIITDHLDDPNPDTYENRIIEVVTGSESVEVTILTNPETPNATTLYTLNGEIPVEGDDVVTNGSITLPAITETTIITAISYIEVEDGQGGYTKVWSSPVTRTYTFVKSNGVVYDLLTTAPTVGNVYVIVNKDAYMGMSTAQSGNNRASTGVKFTDNTKEHVYGNDELALFVLENANAGRYYFKNINGNGYLTVTTNDYANLSTSATASSYSEAAVAIGDQAAGYPATIRFNYDGTNRYLRYFAKGRTFTTNADATLNENVFLYGTDATPLAKIESEMNAGDNVQVTVADDLIAAWAVDNGTEKYVWAKDMGYSINKTSPVTGQKDYMMDVLKWQKNDWDQSNWVILDFSGVSDIDINDLNALVGKKLAGGTVTGNYVEGKNNGGNYRIVLNSMINNPIEDAEAAKYPGLGVATAAITANADGKYNPANYDLGYNTYMTGNFNRANLNAPYGNGFVAGDDAAPLHQGEKLFFMNPKAQEVVRIWGVWDGKKFTVWECDKQNVNGWAIKGAFDVNWSRNAVSLSPLVYDEPDALTSGTEHIFHAVVALKQNTTGPNGAPRRASVDDETGASDEYEIYPLDVSNSGNPTSVTVVQAVKEGVSVRYYNVMGMESEKPFEGINIVVTRYSDGSASTVKVLR